MARGRGIREFYTVEDQDELVAYIARNNPPKEGRCGNRLYIQLYENLDNQWPWSSRHSWQSWRAQYEKNQEWYNYQIKKYQKEHGIKRDAPPVKLPTTESAKRPASKRVKINHETRARERDSGGTLEAEGSKHASKAPKKNAVNGKCSSAAKKKSLPQSDHSSREPPNDTTESAPPQSNGITTSSPSRNPDPTPKASTSRQPPAPPSPSPPPANDQPREDVNGAHTIALPELPTRTDTQVLSSPNHTAPGVRGLANASTISVHQPSPSFNPFGETRTPLKRKRALSIDEDIFGTPPPSAPQPSCPGASAPTTRNGPSARTLPRTVNGWHGVSLEDSRGRPRPLLKESLGGGGGESEDGEDGGGSQPRKTWPPIRASQRRKREQEPRQAQQEPQTPTKQSNGHPAGDVEMVNLASPTPQKVAAPSHRRSPSPSPPLEEAHHPFSQALPPLQYPPPTRRVRPDIDYISRQPKLPRSAAAEPETLRHHPFSQVYTNPSTSAVPPAPAEAEGRRRSRRGVRAVLSEFVGTSSGGAAVAGEQAQRDQQEGLNGNVEPAVPMHSSSRLEHVNDTTVANAVASSSKVTLDEMPAPAPTLSTAVPPSPARIPEPSAIPVGAPASGTTPTPRSGARPRASTTRQDMRELGRRIIDGSYSPLKKASLTAPGGVDSTQRTTSATASPEKKASAVASAPVAEVENDAASQSRPHVESRDEYSVVLGATAPEPPSTEATSPVPPTSQRSIRKFTPPSTIDASPFRVSNVPTSVIVSKSRADDNSALDTSVRTTIPHPPLGSRSRSSERPEEQPRPALPRHLDPDLIRRRQTFGGYDTSSHQVYAPSVDFVALAEEARSRSRGSSSARGVSDNILATRTVSKRKRARISVPVTISTPRAVEEYDSDNGPYPQPLFPSVSRSIRLDQSRVSDPISPSTHHAPPARPSLSSADASLVLQDLPALDHLSPADHTLITLHGYSHIIARMAAHHGFAVETVRACIERTRDLRDADEALRALHDVVARHEDRVFRRVRRQSRARRASEVGAVRGGAGDVLGGLVGGSADRRRSVPEPQSVKRLSGASRWAAEIDDESTPLVRRSGGTGTVARSQARTSASGLRYKVVSGDLESQEQSSDYEPPKQTRAALWKRLSMGAEAEPDDSEAQGGFGEEEQAADGGEDETGGAEAEEMPIDLDEDEDLEMRQTETEDDPDNVSEVDDDGISISDGTDSEGEIEASVRMSPLSDEVEGEDEPGTPIATQVKEQLKPRPSVLRRAIGLFARE
ncbi:hypothetical protein CONPUDRAFT_162893 [Coniophora puteana RWD-64-598 SS2]|uniref:TERF2-interacting telomeric protein 1 Myb domain-containing protein n=1 Tax=Coniophora puteana (strain RWD-64-598) TaxID=741705 RepID=A0A5M3N3B6_CONPW|nr:uncharacterized protein CONPUDRAFT_162893 [Coniophora puteana RWD-64-598 SS2]EIW85816.1 hypothetical protein CONPUDRAFT_162893 [Coniophora puteana RWD-64-598 SS2]